MGIHGAAAEQLFSAVFGPGSGLTPSMKEMDEGEVDDLFAKAGDEAQGDK